MWFTFSDSQKKQIRSQSEVPLLAVRSFPIRRREGRLDGERFHSRTDWSSFSDLSELHLSDLDMKE